MILKTYLLLHQFQKSTQSLKIPSKSEKKTISSAENSITHTLAPQKLPLLPRPVAPAITLAKTPRPVHIPIRLILILFFTLPLPPLTKTVVRKSKSFEN